MDYLRVYNELIHEARTRDVVGDYTEIHHVIPRSEGGSDDVTNLVNLTPREHYIAHKLLFLDNPTIKSRITTFWLMSNGHSVNSGRVYEELKRRFIDIMAAPKTEEHKRKISKALKGKPKSKDSIEKMKANLGDRSGKHNSNYGKGRPIMGDGVLYENSQRAAEILGCSKQNIGYRLNSPRWNWYYVDGNGTREYNLTKNIKGRRLSEEHIEKIREARTGQKIAKRGLDKSK